MGVLSAIGKAALENISKIKAEYLKGKSALKVTQELFDKEAIRANPTVEKIIKDLRTTEGVFDPVSNKVVKITPKELEKRPAGASQAAYYNDPEISQRIKDGAESGMNKSEFLAANPDLSKPSVNNFLEVTGTEWGTLGKAGAKFQPKITERLKQIQEILIKNPDASINDIQRITKLPPTDLNNAIQAFKDAYVKGRPDFEPIKSIENSVNKLQTNLLTTFEQSLNNILIKYDIDPSAISKETRNKLLRSRRAVQEFFESGTNFEHQLPKSLLKYIDDPDTKVELLLTGSRTSPELNQFKLKYDRLLNGAVSRLKGTSKDKIKYTLKEYNDEVNRIREEVRKTTGGYEIGYLKFDKSGKATAVTPGSKSLLKGDKIFGPETVQKISPFENAKYHNKLIENYKDDPDNPVFNTLRQAFPDPNQLQFYKNQEQAFSSIRKFLNVPRSVFMKFANKNMDNPVVQAIFKSPYGKAATLTTVGLLPQRLIAGENENLEKNINILMDQTFNPDPEYSPMMEMQSEVQEDLFQNPPRQNEEPIEFGDPETWDKKVLDFVKEYPVTSGVAAGTTTIGGAALTKTGRKALGTLGKTLISTPIGAAAINLGVGLDPKETLDRVFLEAELAAAPGLIKGAEAMTTNPLLRKALTLGISPRMAAGLSGVGITALIGEGLYELGKRGVAEYKKLEAMTPEEKEEYLATEVQPLMEETTLPENYAIGGRVGLKDGSYDYDSMDHKINSLIKHYNDYLKMGGKMKLKDFAPLFARENFKDGSKPPKMDRRLFMKIMAGIMSLPILGKVGKVAKPTAKALVNEMKNAPPHFKGLVNKIMTLGKIVEPKYMSDDVKRNYINYQYKDYDMLVHKSDGRVQITKPEFMSTEYGDATVSEEYMSYAPKTPKFNKKGEKIPGEYEDEYEEYTTYADTYGEMQNVEEGVRPNTIDDGTFTEDELAELAEQIEKISKK